VTLAKNDVIQLLQIAGSYDGRKASEAAIHAWSDAAGRVRWTYDEAAEAIKAHYADSTDFIMPAHVTKRIKATRQDRAMREPVTPPDPTGQAKIAKAITGVFQVVDDEPVKPWIKLLADSKRETQERRKRILSYPDLAEKLMQPPLSLTDPAKWNGYISPKTLPSSDGNPYDEVNDSPVRRQLVAIATEALKRENEATS
jgi:hypothetical protein